MRFKPEKVAALKILLLLAGVAFFVSCAYGNGKKSILDKPTKSISDNEKKTTESTYINRYGDVISRFADKSPQRIVSIAPSTTEMLFEYGIGELICGATEPHNYPPKAMKLETIGHQMLNTEKIVSLKPDIIIGEKNLFLGQTETIGELGIPILLFDTRSVDDIFGDLIVLDRICKEQKAEELFQNAISELETVSKPERPCRVAGIISSSPMILAARNSYLSSIISISGCTNIAGDIPGDYVTFSREELLIKNPDMIIVTFGGIRDELNRDESLKRVAAIKNKKIMEVNPDVFLRPTLRSIREGAVILRKYCGEK